MSQCKCEARSVWYFDQKKEFDALVKDVRELKTLFLSINQRMNAVQELYELFSGKSLREAGRGNG